MPIRATHNSKHTHSRTGCHSTNTDTTCVQHGRREAASRAVLPAHASTHKQPTADQHTPPTLLYPHQQHPNRLHHVALDTQMVLCRQPFHGLLLSPAIREDTCRLLPGLACQIQCPVFELPGRLLLCKQTMMVRDGAGAAHKAPLQDVADKTDEQQRANR